MGICWYNVSSCAEWHRGLPRRSDDTFRNDKLRKSCNQFLDKVKKAKLRQLQLGLNFSVIISAGTERPGYSDRNEKIQCSQSGLDALL